VPLPKTLREHVDFEIRMAYTLAPQSYKRGFGGSASGKGRHADAIPFLAKAMAARLDYAMTFAPASVGDLERVICLTMAATSPEAAYETVVRSVNEHEAARRLLAARITDDLLGAFQFERKAFTGLHPITASSYPPGWNWRERLKGDAN
jgi:hypothetical protein